MQAETTEKTETASLMNFHEVLAGHQHVAGCGLDSGCQQTLEPTPAGSVGIVYSAVFCVSRPGLFHDLRRIVNDFELRAVRRDGISVEQPYTSPIFQSVAETTFVVLIRNAIS
jgi:hypothetical protein